MRGDQRRTLLVLGLLYVAALAMRLWFWKIPAYGDEGAFYYTARHLTAAAPNVHDLYVPEQAGLAAHAYYRPTPPVFWYRPAHFLVLWPAAQFGFEAYRLWSLLLTSLLAPLSALLLRSNGVRWVAASAAGATLATMPYSIVWSVITTPDALMTTWFVAGLCAWTRGRRAMAGAFFLGAVWTKEVAALGVVGLLAWNLWRRHQSGDPGLWPLRFSRGETILAGVILLSPVPLMAALAQGGYFPSGHGHAGVGWVVDASLLSAWFGLALLLGVTHTRSRMLACLGLLYPAFYVVYELGGRFTNLWYLMLPTTLAVIGTAASLDVWAQETAKMPGRGRAAAVLVSLAAVGLVAALVLAPASTMKSALLQPVSGRNVDNLWQAHAFESARDQDRDAAFAAAGLGPDRRFFVVDVYGADLLHPIATSGAFILQGESGTVHLFRQELAPWVDAIENQTDLVILKIQGTALNAAVRLTYADCFTFEAGDYVLIDGRSCAGRGVELARRYAEGRSG